MTDLKLKCTEFDAINKLRIELSFVPGLVPHKVVDAINALIDAKIALALAPAEVENPKQEANTLPPFNEKITIQALKEWVDAIHGAYPDTVFNAVKSIDINSFTVHLNVKISLDKVQDAIALANKSDDLPSFVVAMGS